MAVGSLYTRRPGVDLLVQRIVKVSP